MARMISVLYTQSVGPLWLEVGGSSISYTFLKDASIEDGHIEASPGFEVALESCLLRRIALNIALHCNGFSSVFPDDLRLHR